MRKRSIPLLLVGAIAVAATLVLGPAATAGSQRASAGTVVFIHDQEPPNLNQNFVGNGLYATSLVTNNIFIGGQIRDNKSNWVLRNFKSAPKLVKKSPLTIKVEYKADARWSDGKPVTAADLRATWRIYINPANNVISRTGWEDIKSVKGNGKTATVVFKRPFAAWESLVSGSTWPAHIVRGMNMNTAFQSSIPVSDGPWMFQSWQKGVQLSVRKNPRYTAGPAMKLDRVVFRYILDTNARFQALKSNEGQVMEPQPQLQIAEFMSDKKFKVDRAIGYSYEHVDIQFGPKGNPALKLPYVRQALVTGMNRKQIAGTLYKEIAPGLPQLDSLIFKPFESAYKKNFGKYAFNQQKVIQLLRGKGCTGGPSTPSASNNDIFSCPGVGKLSFRFFTTTGNQLRALTFEIVQRQLKSVGIELVPRFQVGGTLFGTTLPSGDWDLIMYTYVQEPDSKILAKDLYACGGDQNYGAYCNRKLTNIMNRVAVTLDAKTRDSLLNQAEAKYMVKDLPSIPLYARPIYVIRSTKVNGPVVNPTQEGSPWNANSWTATA
jgi:peptide/nickel transport system substrate-binding protein